MADMRRLQYGFSIAIAISVVAELGIPDLLAQGPKSTSDLARSSGANEQFLQRVLRFLASEGVFAEEDGDRFAPTELSEWLRSDVPGSLRPIAIFVFDMPEVTATALPALERAGVAQRCELISGDFFESLPAGGDLYALKFILHDWPDAECMKILENCRDAMAPDARVLIIEHVAPEDSGPDFSNFMDMNMLVLTSGGRERTRREFAQLLDAAGLQLRKFVPTSIGLHVLEAERSPGR